MVEVKFQSLAQLACQFSTAHPYSQKSTTATPDHIGDILYRRARE